MSKFADAMNAHPPDNVLFRVLFVLHLGLSDLRYIAKSGRAEQAYDLADTLENIPGFLANWEDGHLELIKRQLEHYQAKYRSVNSSEYSKYLTEKDAPDRF